MAKKKKTGKKKKSNRPKGRTKICIKCSGQCRVNVAVWGVSFSGSVMRSAH